MSGNIEENITPEWLERLKQGFDHALDHAPLVEHLEFIVSEIDADPATLNSARLHWVGIYLLRLIARERGLT